ncbi:hypothetical protein [Halocynthiibacter namhaensis]|uniref:hypothetical protein n=1 Tax=Halocynthiibacter namhaensis TaxID=1290553 RepID=UPI0012E02ECB|nr:hypothetical protein [Halocynthiibacter namhaensis]
MNRIQVTEGSPVFGHSTGNQPFRTSEKSVPIRERERDEMQQALSARRKMRSPASSRSRFGEYHSMN